VMYFSNGAIGKQNEELAPLSKGIADMLITQLAGNPGIRVVERDQLEKLLQEQNISSSGRVDKETAVQVGKILGAHHMIFGGFVTDPKGRMRLDARAVNVETSQIEHVESVPGKIDDLMDMIDRLAGKMNSGMKLPEIAKTVRDASSESARKVPFQAVMLYSRALAAQDKGDRAEAVTLFRASLDKFPEYGPAKKALARLETRPGA
jgi:curli biogenesis system outer membrane secretion channel CsgG